MVVYLLLGLIGFAFITVIVFVVRKKD